MSCSAKFAIPANEQNRELIRYLNHGIFPQDRNGEDIVFTFTINRSGFVGNRKVSSLKGVHRYDDDRCNNNEVHLLDVSKI